MHERRTSKRNLVFTGVAILVAATAVAFMPATGFSTTGSIEYVRTDAAAAQTGTCSAGDTCLEWCMVTSSGPPEPMGIFCCGNEWDCDLAPGGNV